MKLKNLLFLAIGLFTFSCGGDENNDDPQPGNVPVNDNSTIVGDWKLRYEHTELYDPGHNFVSGGYATQNDSINDPLIKFRSQGILEDFYLSGPTTYAPNEIGTFNLKGKVLSINMPQHSFIRSADYHVYKLTSNNFVILDTIFNYDGQPGYYEITQIRMYR